MLVRLICTKLLEIFGSVSELRNRSGAVAAFVVLVAVFSTPAPADASRGRAPAAACIPGYHAAFHSEEWMTVFLNPGVIEPTWIKLTNIGCNTWTKGTSSEVRLGTFNPVPGQDQPSILCYAGAPGWLNSQCHRIPQTTQSVAYGQVALFDFWIKAPNGTDPEGNYRVHLRPLVEGVTWMENLGIWMEARTPFYWGVRNTPFKKPNGSPILPQQSNCAMCVAAGTEGWVSYAWIKQDGYDSHPQYTQNHFWNSYFATTLMSNSTDMSAETVTNCVSYPRKKINASKDDGVDPYGAVWGTYVHTPPGHHYQMNTFPSLDLATRGLADVLEYWDEPAAVLIDKGKHYVLAVGVMANQDPNDFFWTTTISKVFIRDPILPVGSQKRMYEHNGVNGPWGLAFRPYGEGNIHPWCGNCIDDARKGYGSYQINTANTALWWNKFVIVMRGPSNLTPDQPRIW